MTSPEQLEITRRALTKMGNAATLLHASVAKLQPYDETRDDIQGSFAKELTYAWVQARRLDVLENVSLPSTGQERRFNKRQL